MRYRRSNRIIEHPPISSSSKYFQRNSTRRNPERESSSSSFIHNGARSRASRSERASIYAHTHAYTHLHTRTVDGSHSTPHYFLARSVDQQKEAPLKRYIPPPSPSRRSSIFSPRFFCSSFPDGPLINSIHRRRFQLDRVARTRGDIPLLPPPAHLTAATFKVSNELGMIHGFAGLGRLGTRAPPRTEPRACPLRRRRRRREYFRIRCSLCSPRFAYVRVSSRKILAQIVKL